MREENAQAIPDGTLHTQETVPFLLEKIKRAEALAEWFAAERDWIANGS